MKRPMMRTSALLKGDIKEGQHQSPEQPGIQEWRWRGTTTLQCQQINRPLLEHHKDCLNLAYSLHG